MNIESQEMPIFYIKTDGEFLNSFIVDNYLLVLPISKVSVSVSQYLYQTK